MAGTASKDHDVGMLAGHAERARRGFEGGAARQRAEQEAERGPQTGWHENLHEEDLDDVRGRETERIHDPDVPVVRETTPLTTRPP